MASAQTRIPIHKLNRQHLEAFVLIHGRNKFISDRFELCCVGTLDSEIVETKISKSDGFDGEQVSELMKPGSRISLTKGIQTVVPSFVYKWLVNNPSVVSSKIRPLLTTRRLSQKKLESELVMVNMSKRFSACRMVCPSIVWDWLKFKKEKDDSVEAAFLMILFSVRRQVDMSFDRS
jgi:hypothetical protein